MYMDSCLIFLTTKVRRIFGISYIRFIKTYTQVQDAELTFYILTGEKYLHVYIGNELLFLKTPIISVKVFNKSLSYRLEHKYKNLHVLHFLLPNALYHLVGQNILSQFSNQADTYSDK